MKIAREIFDKFGIAGELLAFLWHRKLWWMIPFVAVLLLFGIPEDRSLTFFSIPILSPFHLPFLVPVAFLDLITSLGGDIERIAEPKAGIVISLQSRMAEIKEKTGWEWTISTIGNVRLWGESAIE